MVSGKRSRKIIVGVDGSPESRHALEWAVHEADRTNGEIQAVHAYDSGLAWIDVGSEYQSLILEQSAAKAKQTLHETLRWLAAECQSSVPVHPLTAPGEPAQVLVDLARDADLLVVGARGRGGFAGLLLGSVSQRCVERSSCPVVVVPATPSTPSGEDRP